MSDNQKKGKCSHSMAATDPHTRCALCRTCDVIDKPCSVCCSLTTEQRQAAVKARASRLRRLARRKERATSVDSSSSLHSSVGSDSRPNPESSVSGQGGTEGAGAPLEVVVAVRTGLPDSTAVTLTEPRTDSVAIVTLCKQGADKRPLDPSRKRVREQEGPDPSRKRACERAVARVARKRSKGNAATLDPPQRSAREQAALDPPLRRACEQAVLDPLPQRASEQVDVLDPPPRREREQDDVVDNPCEREIVHDAGDGGEIMFHWDGAPLHYRGRSRSPRGRRSRSPSYEREEELDYSESETWVDDTEPGPGSWQFPARRDLDEPRASATLAERRPDPTAVRRPPVAPARRDPGGVMRHGPTGSARHGPARHGPAPRTAPRGSAGSAFGWREPVVPTLVRRAPAGHPVTDIRRKSDDVRRSARVPPPAHSSQHSLRLGERAPSPALYSSEYARGYGVEGVDGQGREDVCGRHRPLPPSEDVTSMCQQIMLTLGRVSASNEALVARVANLERRDTESLPPSSPLPQSDDDREDAISVDLAVDSYSEEEGDNDESRREWLSHHASQSPTPMAVEVARPAARTAAVPPRDDGQSSRGEGQSATDESEAGRYRDTLDAVYRVHDTVAMPPAPAAVESCGHALAAMSQAPAKAERYKSLPQAVAITNCLRHMNSTIRGVAHSPLDPPGRVCEDAQKWGNHVSLSSPSIRQYRPEYYRMHYPEDVPEEGRLHPHTLWSTSASASVLKRAAPTEVKVRVSQLRDWESIARASLGVINHLDWFVASVYQVINGLDINPEGKTDANNFLSSACTAINHLAHLQVRNLTSNATIRREAFLDASVLGREDAHYLRSLGIGSVDLLGGESKEAIKRASEEKRTALLFQSAVGAPRRPAPPATAQTSRFPRGQRARARRGKFVPSNAAPARKSTKPPTAAPAPHRYVKAGRGGKIGVTNRYDPKPKV